MKCDGARAETRFRLSEKGTRPFKSAGASVQSTTGSRGVCDSHAGYTKFRGSVKGIGYPLYSPVSPSLPLPCVTVCRHFSTGLYLHCDPEYNQPSVQCKTPASPRLKKALMAKSQMKPALNMTFIYEAILVSNSSLMAKPLTTLIA